LQEKRDIESHNECRRRKGLLESDDLKLQEKRDIESYDEGRGRRGFIESDD
jgi:hypothetical protein